MMERGSTNLYMELARPLLVGAATGTANAVMLQPFDRVKTVMQDPSMKGRDGFLGVSKMIIKKNGVTTLWRGTAPSLLRVVPGAALYFGSIEWLKMAFIKGRNPRPAENMCLGAFGRCFAGAVIMPATVLKTRYESEFYAYRSVSSAFGDIVRTEGLKGLFAGLVPTMLRDGPYSGIYLLVYRLQLDALSPAYMDVSWSILIRLAAGFSSGLFACAVTHPFDVIKTKTQLFPHKYSSMLVSTRVLYTESGIKGFMRGFLPRAMRRTAMTAFTWSMFDEIMTYFKSRKGS